MGNQKCCDERLERETNRSPRRHGGSLTSSTLPAIAAGLASSSCCALQLAANAAGLGCAGFNKLLGPHRNLARAITAAYLLALWIAALRPTRRSRTSVTRAAASTLLCLTLTLLPELLLFLGGTAMAPPTRNSHDLALRLEGMGCEACGARVRTLLERSAGVIGADVRFEDGTATVRVADAFGFNYTEVSRLLSYEGYEVIESSGTLETSTAPETDAPPGGKAEL